MCVWYKRIATLGPIGYLHLPGTMGSLVSMGAVYLIHAISSSFVVYGIIILVSCVASIYIINKALVTLNHRHDPSEIVLDELVGILVTFWGIPLTFQWTLVGFFLFRIFDITKVGIGRLEQLPSGTGIVFDDVAAGIVSNLTLHLFIYFS